MDDFDNGWDARAELVEDRWVDRTPRRPQVEPRMRREAQLMPWLAPQLPLPVAVPAIVEESPLRVRHELVPGGPCPGTDPRHGEAVGSFLAALHGVDTVAAVALGIPDAEASYSEAQATRDRCRGEVLPRLPATDHPAATALLDRMSIRPTRTCLVHADLGPDHVRVVGGEVTGIIDWMDAHIGDPALDLSWVLHGTSAEFGAAVATGYRVDEEQTRRALDWHLMGPWHEVVHGVDTGQPHLVDGGMAGVRDRLTARP
ncbi:MAG: phosphotransferase [Nocardioidaceae bacterium]